MKRWVIADLHFGHENILKYSNRPFKSVEEMDKSLIDNWNGIVSKDDLVFVLGDFILSHDKQYIKNIVNQLNGRKVLVRGNHDTLPNELYIEVGFNQVTKYPLYLTADNVILMHKPIPIENIHLDIKYIFGHVHDKYCTMDDLNNCYCVSVERINYTPADLDKILKQIKTK